MIPRVALRNVLRHRLRTAFTTAALAIAVALLADMLMLSAGMEKTFYRVLSSVGYEVRVCPFGTLPFATEAVIPESSRLTRALDDDARVERWLRVLGTTLYADSTPLFAMGIDGRAPSLYRVTRGEDMDALRDDDRIPVLLNENAAAALGVEVGDALALRVGAPGTTSAFTVSGVAAESSSGRGWRGDGAPASSDAAWRRDRTRGRDGDIRPVSNEVVVAGIIAMEFDLVQQRSVVMPLEAVNRLRPETRDAASFVLVKLRAPDHRDQPFAPVDEQQALAASLAEAFPELSVYSIENLMSALQRQLAYFKQFALILSTISLLTTFLLIAVVLAIGVAERRGEIAALRSMGFRCASVRGLVLAECVVLLAIGAVAGSVLGWLLAGWLDRILTQSPSLPAGYRFFIPAPREIVLAVLITGVAGMSAALVPAVFASRVDIPGTLHEEVV